MHGEQYFSFSCFAPPKVILNKMRDTTVKKQRGKNQQPFYWYFVNKICFGKKSTKTIIGK